MCSELTLSVSNSILKHYDIKPFHKTCEELDRYINRNYKNIVLIVFDGLGYDLLTKNALNGILAKNIKSKLNSVCPSITPAALTSIETGLYPIQTGWIGTNCYFKEYNQTVNLYTGKDKYYDNNIVVGGELLSHKYMPIKHIVDLIYQKNNNVSVAKVSPFGEYKAYSSYDICEHLFEILKTNSRTFTYCYNFQPDYDAHIFGCYSNEVKNKIEEIEKSLESLLSISNDTLIIITADHGLIDLSKTLCFDDFPDISECLLMRPSLDARCISFFVKKEKINVFPKVFNSYFGKQFLLYKKEEIINKNIFGAGIPYKRGLEFIGDYIAIANGDIAIENKNINGGYHDLKADHAGLTSKE